MRKYGAVVRKYKSERKRGIGGGGEVDYRTRSGIGERKSNKGNTDWTIQGGSRGH